MLQVPFYVFLGEGGGKGWEGGEGGRGWKKGGRREGGREEEGRRKGRRKGKGGRGEGRRRGEGVGKGGKGGREGGQEEEGGQGKGGKREEGCKTSLMFRKKTKIPGAWWQVLQKGSGKNVPTQLNIVRFKVPKSPNKRCASSPTSPACLVCYVRRNSLVASLL